MGYEDGWGDVMSKEMHIFVSEKGSAGKTTQALSLALFFMSKSYNVVIVDFNRQNPDLEDVFANFSAKVKIVELFEQPYYLKKTLPVAGRMGGKTFTFIKPMFVPNGPKEMWRFLQMLTTEESNGTKFVVDTGENIHNFVIKSHYENGKLNQNIIPEVDFAPIFWYTWLWSAPASQNKMRRMEDAIKYLSSSIDGWGDNHLINVFNVYRINEKVKKLHRIVNVIKKRYRSPNIDPTPLSFDRIMKCIGIVAKSLGINDPSRDEIKVKEIPGLWMGTFERMLDVLGGDKVFSNICILEAVPRVTMFIDQIIMSRPTRISQVRKLLDKFYVQFVEFAKLYVLSQMQVVADTPTGVSISFEELDEVLNGLDDVVVSKEEIVVIEAKEHS